MSGTFSSSASSGHQGAGWSGKDLVCPAGSPWMSPHGLSACCVSGWTDPSPLIRVCGEYRGLSRASGCLGCSLGAPPIHSYPL